MSDKDDKKGVVDRLEVSLVKMSLNLKLAQGITVEKILISLEIESKINLK